MVELWIGSNIYNIKAAKADLLSQYPEHQVINMLLSTDNIAEIVSNIKLPDLFSSKKIYFIRVDNWPDDKIVKSIISSGNHNNIIVLLLTNTRKTDKTFQAMGLNIRHFKPLNISETAVWLKTKLDNIMPSLGSEVKKYIINSLDGVNDQQFIMNELSKLQNVRDIDLDLVQKLIIPPISSNIFKLLDIILSQDKKKARSMLFSLRPDKEEKIKIQTMLGWQISTMVEIKISYLLKEPDLIKLFKINPYVVNKLSAKVKLISKSRLLEISSNYINIISRARQNNISDDLVLDLLIDSL